MDDNPYYTWPLAQAEVGDSTDWEVARHVSLKKWRQIADGDSYSYPTGCKCGYCFVAMNITDETPPHCCTICPVHHDRPRWCTNANLNVANPHDAVRWLENLEHPEEELA